MFNLTKIIKVLSILAICSSFFFSTNLLIGKYFCNISIIFLGIIFCILIFLKQKKLINNFFHILSSKSNPLKLFFIFFISSVVISCLLMPITLLKMTSFILLVISYTVQIFFVLWITYYLVKNYIKTEALLKGIILTIYIILILGIVEMYSYTLDIPFLQEVFKIFHTRWLSPAIEDTDFVKFVVHDYSRTQGVFDEPSQFGWFIFMTCPFVLNFKYKITLFKNKILDNFIKCTIIPLMYIDLFLTLSPMMIFFTMTLTSISLYFKLKESKIIKKYFFHLMPIIIIAIMFIVLFCIFSIESEQLEWIIARITNVFSIRSMNDFVEMEPSLATRVCVTICNIFLLLEYPIFGVGLGQNTPYMQILMKSPPIPVTKEVYLRSMSGDISSCGFMTKIYTETGIFGWLIFMYAFYKTYKFICNAIKIVRNSYSEVLLKGISQCMIAILVLFFYDMYFTTTFVWIIIATGIAIAEKIKDSSRKMI